MTDASVPDDGEQLPALPDWGPTDGVHGTDADPAVADGNDPNTLDRGDEQDRPDAADQSVNVE
jgi:hypothetical protein